MQLMTIFCTRVYQNFSPISGITIFGIISILWVTNPSISGIENINLLSGKELIFWSAALFRQTISSISLSPSTSSLILLSCLFKMEVKFAEHDLLSIFHYFIYLFLKCSETDSMTFFRFSSLIFSICSLNRFSCKRLWLSLSLWEFIDPLVSFTTCVICLILALSILASSIHFDQSRTLFVLMYEWIGSSCLGHFAWGSSSILKFSLSWSSSLMFPRFQFSLFASLMCFPFLISE